MLSCFKLNTSCLGLLGGKALKDIFWSRWRLWNDRARGW